MPFPQDGRLCASWGTIGSRPPLKGQLVLQAPPTMTIPDISMELLVGFPLAAAACH